MDWQFKFGYCLRPPFPPLRSHRRKIDKCDVVCNQNGFAGRKRRSITDNSNTVLCCAVLYYDVLDKVFRWATGGN